MLTVWPFRQALKGQPSNALPVADGETLLDRVVSQIIAGKDDESERRHRQSWS